MKVSYFIGNLSVFYLYIFVINENRVCLIFQIEKFIFDKIITFPKNKQYKPIPDSQKPDTV
jgi:hypothetical protein